MLSEFAAKGSGSTEISMMSLAYCTVALGQMLANHLCGGHGFPFFFPLVYDSVKWSRGLRELACQRVCDG